MCQCKIRRMAVSLEAKRLVGVSSTAWGLDVKITEVYDLYLYLKEVDIIFKSMKPTIIERREKRVYSAQRR